jgi:hypothetical protein
MQGALANWNLHTPKYSESLPKWLRKVCFRLKVVLQMQALPRE